MKLQESYGFMVMTYDLFTKDEAKRAENLPSFSFINRYTENVHRNRAFAFPMHKKHLPKHSICFPMKYHLKDIDLGIKVC